MNKNLPSPKTTRKGTQIGRGMGSGRGGHYAGRGGKGQTARSKYSGSAGRAGEDDAKNAQAEYTA